MTTKKKYNKQALEEGDRMILAVYNRYNVSN